MDNSLHQPELQLRTLGLYGELLCRRDSWSRQLVLAAFPGASETGLSAAASLAGAVSLVVDADAALMKTHFRDGAFDFVVNTLDEALRAIKNEIRRGNSLAIGLISEPSAVLKEASERGLAARFVLTNSEVYQLPHANVAETDAALVDLGNSTEPSRQLASWLSQRAWSPVEIVAPKHAGSAGDRIRQRWLRDLSKYQRSVRQGNRWMWLSPEEEQDVVSPE
ncbi:MAG TPA: hypothetical protein VFC39_15035 [Acidobacteriaceae bacterium]|nr:hypothetical protein [Acidobacteriaceae bacterium]